MDGETAAKSNYIITKPSFEYKERQPCKASASKLPGGDGGGPNYITPKSILYILRQRRALGVVFKEALH